MKKIIFSIITLIVFSCSGGGDDDSPTVTPEPKVPSAANLIFPINNSECTEGTNVTENNSTILFEWMISANTDSYELVIKNLDTNTETSYSSTINEKSVELARATPYSWYIISKSNTVSDTATSASWKFYNAGEGEMSYAPFPATVVSPEDQSNVTGSSVTLEWSGSDVDNDIAYYDVYFGVGSNISVIAEDVTSNSLSNVTVSSGNSYVWYVVTTDQEGNSSNSEHFSFNVQ